MARQDVDDLLVRWDGHDAGRLDGAIDVVLGDDRVVAVDRHDAVAVERLLRLRQRFPFPKAARLRAKSAAPVSPPIPLPTEATFQTGRRSIVDSYEISLITELWPRQWRNPMGWASRFKLLQASEKKNDVKSEHCDPE